MVDRIDVVLTDAVDATVSSKFRSIATDARAADAAIKQLQADLANVDVTALSMLAEASAKNSTAMAQQALAEQRLATERERTTAATARAQAAQIALTNAVAKQNTALQSASGLANAAGSAGKKLGDDLATAGGHGSSGIAGITRELIVMGREIGRGDVSRLSGSATILATRMGALSAAALPFTLAIGAVLAVIAALAFVTISAENELNKLNFALSSTGSYAGGTVASFQAMGKAIADTTNTSVGKANENITALVATGQFSSDTIKNLVTAAAELSRQSGEDSSKIIGDFEKMKDGVYAYALQWNSSHHEMSTTQLDYIRQLEERGQVEQAQLEMSKVIAADAAKSHVESLGLIIDQWNNLKSWISGTLDELKKFMVAFNTAQGQLDRSQFLPNAIRGIGNMIGGDGVGDFLAKPLDDDNKRQQANVDFLKMTGDALDRAKTNYANYNAEQQRAQTLAEKLAPKQSQINKLMSERIQLQTALGKGQISQDQYNASNTEIDNQINRLQKGIAGPHGPKGPKDPAIVQADENSKVIKDVNDQLTNQIGLYGMVGIKRQEQEEYDKIQQQLLKTGKNGLDINTDSIDKNGNSTAKLRDQIKAKIATQIEEKAVQAQLDTIYTNATGEAQKYEYQLKALALAQSQLGTPNQTLTAPQIKAQTNVVQRAHTDATDPTASKSRDIQDQIKNYSLLANQRTIQQQLDQLDDGWYASKGEHIDATKLQYLKGQLTAQQELEKYTAARDSIDASSQISQTEQLNRQINATIELYNRGRLSIQEYTTSMFDLKTAQLSLSIDKGQGNFTDTLLVGMRKLADGYKGILPGLRDDFVNTFNELASSVGSNLGQILTGAETLADGVKNVVTSAVSELISGLVKLGIQWLITQAVGQSAGAVATATTLAQAAAASTAWAPAAIDASIASFGAADAAGLAGYSAAHAGAGLASILGGLKLAGGGPVVGPGGPRADKVQAWLSNGEYVVNAAATSQNRTLLEAINNGSFSRYQPAFADGGYVGQSFNSTPAAMPRSSNDNSNGDTHAHFDMRGSNFGGVDQATVEARFRKVFKEELGPATVQASRQAAFADQTQYRTRPALNSRKRN